MKTIKILKIVLVLFLTLTFFACNENDISVRELNEVTDTDIIRSILENGQKGIPFPEGSTVQKTNVDNFTISLPNGYFYVVKDINSSKSLSPQTQLLSALSVTCSCTKGSGCSPVKYEDDYYCVMNSGCQTCSMSTTKPSISNGSEVVLLGLVNKNVGITLISDQELPKYKKGDLINHENFIKNKEVIHGNAFTELFELSEVKKYFAKLGQDYKENMIKPNSYAFLNVYGNLMLVPYLSNSVNFEINDVTYEAKSFQAATLELAAAKISCICSKGSGCTKKKYSIPFVGTAYYCDAGNCIKCTLND